MTCPRCQGTGTSELEDILNLSNMQLSNWVTELTLELAKTRAELEEARQGIHIRGWWCPCDIFNGEEKDLHTHCRKCGQAKPSLR